MLMVQSNAPPAKSARVRGPPPVPPRPNQSAVAEALAKTRRAVAESRANLRNYAKAPKETVKSLERTNSLGQVNVSPKQASPKQNGLARVKSFIRDVISDRGSSSDERRSSGHNSRRSSSDSSSIPVPTPHKKSNESLNSKAVKTCKQILVRSLSTSNKLDQDSKSKVTKSSSFVSKTVPLRKAPPPPLSPKPKLRPFRLSRQSTAENKKSPSPKESPELTPYVTPVDAKPLPCDAGSEDAYATVEEVRDVSERLQSVPDVPCTEPNNNEPCLEESTATPPRKNSLERKTSRVTEQLIAEILASRNTKDEAHVVIDKGKDEETSKSPESVPKDHHEMLIYELQSMRSQSSVPELDKCGSECYVASSGSSGIVDDDSDQAYAYILDDDLKSRLRKQYRAISTMSLEGLPPLPKSLSGFAEASDSPPPDSPTHPPSDLRGQMDYLKQEMARLRQLDLSLLSELWSLSESMLEWRRQLERAPRLRPAPPPPPPPPFLRT